MRRLKRGVKNTLDIWKWPKLLHTLIIRLHEFWRQVHAVIKKSTASSVPSVQHPSYSLFSVTSDARDALLDSINFSGDIDCIWSTLP